MRNGVRVLAAVWIAALGCDFDIGVPGVPPAPGRDATRFVLPALHAEPDPVLGGRIVDEHGREVLLRGVNVNAFVEYAAYAPALFTTYPLLESDADQIASFGWNSVRLLLSWSRVEPEPGVYDEAYLDQIEAAVLMLQRRGLYSIVDLHQDARGASLAARPDEVCNSTEVPAFGWDGAPAWATFDGGRRRCTPKGNPLGRELSPAVKAAFQAFWDDVEGPGAPGEAPALRGIRTRYAAMLGHLAARLSQHAAVAGYDVMNEPNAWSPIEGQIDALGALYGQAVAAIRAAEDANGAPHRIVFFEPSIAWGSLPSAPPPFTDDSQIAYAPHLYQGGLDSTPLDATPFELARSEANELFGGAPILSGEWGAGPERAADPSDDYFLLHQRLQDEFRISATIWTWREACGDPHKAADARAGQIPYVWGLFEVDCALNEITGLRTPLASQLTRPALRGATGRVTSLVVDSEARTLEATGESVADGSLLAFLPGPVGRGPQLTGRGIKVYTWQLAPGGVYVSVLLHAGEWRVAIAPGG
jgi:endoglycosylceramidase